MIYQNVQMQNVAAVKELEDGSGVALQRVPEEVRQKLNPNAQTKMLQPGCAEIRFVFDGPSCEVSLSCDDPLSVSVFFGLYQHSVRHVTEAGRTTLTLTKQARLFATDAPHVKDHPFSRHVCRLIFRGGQVRFHGVKGDNVRPPTADEVPSLRLLTYGTSITHGASASAPHLTYASQTARALGADLINLGSGGSAHCEKELSDYIAARDDWNIASLALSVNMRGFTLDDFYDRVSYMVNTVAGSDTSRPVACITLWPFFDDMTEGGKPRDAEGRTSEQYRQKLRDAVAACPYPNVHLFEGPELMSDVSGLTGDLIHPGDYGMIEMGRNLGRELGRLLNR